MAAHPLDGEMAALKPLIVQMNRLEEAALDITPEARLAWMFPVDFIPGVSSIYGLTVYRSSASFRPALIFVTRDG